MSEMLANDITEVVQAYKKPPRQRSPQEILARYNQALETYKDLCFKPQETNQLKLMTHTEIKILGWVLGKPEKDVVRDIAKNSPSMPFGTF